MPRSASPPGRERERDSKRDSHRDRDRDRDRDHRSHRSHHSSSHHRGEGSSSGSRRHHSHRDRDRDRDRESSSHRSRRDDGRKRRSYDSDDDRERSSKRSDKRCVEGESGVLRQNARLTYPTLALSRRHRETSEERRQRKALEKYADLDPEDLVAQRVAAAETSMYSADDNPFNDANLGSKFKWGKKEEKEKKMGYTPEEARARDEERRRHAAEEIAKLNTARAQREAEQAIREEEEAKMARLAESAAMSEWVAKEDDFHLEQSRRRAAIRIRENRAKPIDLLAMNLRWADGDRIAKKRTDDDDDDDDEAGLEIDLEEPYEIFDSLSLSETQELQQDIQMYLTLDKNEQNLDFWRSMMIVCDDKLAELRDEENEGGGTGGVRSSRLDPSVRLEMNTMLSTKTYPQLIALQEQITNKLRSGEPIDVEYWEQLLKCIIVWRAKAKLRDLHAVVLENRLEYLRRKQRDEANKQQEELVAQLGDEVDEEDAGGEATEAAIGGDADDTATREEWSAEMEPPAVDEARLGYDDRRLQVYDEWSQLREEIIAARKKVLGAAFVPRARHGNAAHLSDADNVDASEALFAQEAAKGIDVSEETFNGPDNEANLAAMPSSSRAGNGEHYDWEDKYRPRKPRYFNRVHTGFEWNRYNQTHYDSDNPPPKIVQGYKFNIFYPDLIDKSKAPTYKIIREPGNDETVIIKFEAGAPYEDLAFRIINRPWQYSHKRGFRSSFERGVLQLWFNFQRNFYRK